MPKKTNNEEEKKGGDQDALEHLFGSKTRVRLLRLFLDKPERAYFVREITRRIESQLNSVRREINNMLELGLVKEVENPVDMKDVKKSSRGAASKKKFYQANTEFAFFEELQSIVKKSSALLYDVLLGRLQEIGKVDLLIFTGKMTEAPVETDILIVSNMKSPQIRTVIEEFEHELGREVNYTHMPVEEYRYRKDVRDRFLQKIFQEKHVIVIDDVKEVIKKESKPKK